MLIVACVVLALVVVVFGGWGAVRFVRLQQARRAAVNEMNKTDKAAIGEGTKIPKAVKDGNVAADDVALARLKDQFGKSASALGGSDAEVARVTAGFVGQMQLRVQAHGAALDRLKKEQILSFKVQDRSGLEQNRQIVREFLYSNAQFTTFVEHGEDLLRADLQAARVQDSVIEATVKDYRGSQDQLRRVQLRIRGYDKTLGDTAIAVLDLLDQNWGKWDRDPASGRLRFDDHQTLEIYNALIQKVQATAAEQEKAQQELIALSKSAPAK